MPRDNFMMLRQLRMRDQPTSSLSMQRMALSRGQTPNTNTGISTPRPTGIQQGRPAQSVGNQRAPQPAGQPTYQPPPPYQTAAQPASGTPWQQSGVARSAEQADGGRFYQNGTTWWSAGRPPNYDPAASQVGARNTFATPSLPGAPPQRQLTVDQNGSVVPVVTRAPNVQNLQGSGTRATAPSGLGSGDRRESRPPPSGFATGTSSSGLAPAGSTSTNDQVGNAQSGGTMTASARAEGISRYSQGQVTVTEDGQIIGASGEDYGNINNPASWDKRVADLLWQASNGGKDFDISTNVSSDTRNQTTPDMLAQQNGGINPQTVADFLRQLGLGGPPQMDRSAIDALNDTIAQKYAMQQGRTLQAQSEIASRAGASADQMAGATGDITAQHGLASAEAQNRNELQHAVTNFQQQADFYNKQFQIAMSLYADAQSDEDRNLAFAHAQKMLQLGEESQKRLIAYQQELANQITWKDILGGILGAGSQIGGMALGGWLGGMTGAPTWGGSGPAGGGSLKLRGY